MLPSLTRDGVAGRAASVVSTVDATMLRVEQFKRWLDTITDNYLIGLGFAQADIDLLRSAINDLDQLRSIYQGSSNLVLAKDFRTFAQQVYPFGSI